MDSATGSSGVVGGDKRRQRSRAIAQFVGHDILCSIYTLLDLFDLVRCSVVCKSWNLAFKRSKSMQACLAHMAMKRHRAALVKGSVYVDQWKGHSIGVDKCRMRMGMVLTGVGDKVMRLWSTENYKCLEEYSLSNLGPLVDFDFDESKIVGLVGTRLSIWRRNGNRSAFPPHEGTFPKGLCMRYVDPEALVGCEDGTARVFDMYSRKCSQIIRMHSSSITCLSLGEDQLIMSGSSLGSISLAGPSTDQRVISLRPTDRTGIKTLHYNPSSKVLFSGSTTGTASCWDLRMMKPLWEKKISPNVIYSMHCLHSDTSTLVVGGIDGILRFVNQNTGEILSTCSMYQSNAAQTTIKSLYGGVVERRKVRRFLEDANIDDISRTARPPIKCVAVGMKKVVTTHNGKLT
ncbi:hypothetical protein V2J09_013244 [Rumex salicifolius]